MASKASTTGASAPQSYTHAEIKELLELVSQLGLEELEVESADFRLKIVGRRAPQQVISSGTTTHHLVSSQAPAESAAPAPATPATATPIAPIDNPKYRKVTSPMVGTFYRSPSPDSPQFVQTGDKVDENSVLCIIEAMKLMNEIKAEMRGTVREVLVQNGQPVEYGQPMFLIEPA